jgi:hypothetical protein
MDNFIKRLPTDIVLQIIPYTYNLQNKDLLNDIINYKKTKSLLLELYYKYWIIDNNEDEQEDKYWLINDLIGYANNDEATMFGYVDHFYNIFKRNNSLQTNEAVDKYINKLEKKKVETQINIYLGLFTANERNDIITNFYKIIKQT